jgi:repressor LexA
VTSDHFKEAKMELTKRQVEIRDFIRKFTMDRGYPPSLREIGEHIGVSSPATVHEHVHNMEDKGILKIDWNRNRSLKLTDIGFEVAAVELPLLGRIAAGKPIEAVEHKEMIAIPKDMVGRKETYVLKVVGDSMIGEGIFDGDFVVVEKKETARNGQTVVALIGGSEVTLKKFYIEKDHIKLVPANPNMQPIVVKNKDLQVQGVVIGILRKFK